MKKTLSIGLAGFPFTIEEDAFDLLNRYITSIRATLDPAEAPEVMHDIESRMVEIFQTTMSGRQILNSSDVQNVIDKLGTPEQIEGQDPSSDEEFTQNTARPGKSPEKKLYRNPFNKTIAGVASGMAEYFKVDVSLMRIGWVVAFIIGFKLVPLFLFIAMAYCVLWAILPKAASAADFLRLRGEAPTLENLREVSQKLTNDTTTVNGLDRQGSLEAESGLVRFIRYFFGSIFALMAFCFLATGIAFLFSGLAGNMVWIDGNSVDAASIFQYYLGNQSPWMLYSLVVLATMLPTLLFGLVAIKLFSPKTRVRNLGFLSLGIFAVLLVLSLIFGLQTYQMYEPYSSHNEEVREIALQPQDSLVLVDVNKKPVPTGFRSLGDVHTDGKAVVAEDRPDVEVITDSTATQPFLRVTTEANGKMAMREVADVRTQGNRLLLPDALVFPYKDRLRQYEVHYQLVLPRGIKAKSLSPAIDLNKDSEDENAQFSVTTNEHGARIKINSGHNKAVSITSTTTNGHTEASISVDGQKYKVVEDPAFHGKVQVNGILMSKDQASEILQDIDYFKDEE